MTQKNPKQGGHDTRVSTVNLGHRLCLQCCPLLSIIAMQCLRRPLSNVFKHYRFSCIFVFERCHHLPSYHSQRCDVDEASRQLHNRNNHAPMAPMPTKTSVILQDFLTHRRTTFPLYRAQDRSNW